MKKKCLLPLLMAVMMLALPVMSGCGAGDTGLESRIKELESQLADKQALEGKVAGLEAQLAELSSVEAGDPASNYVIGVNALLSAAGETAEPTGELAFSGPLAVTAAAVVPEGKALSHWSVNGAPSAESGQGIAVDVSGNTVIEAVLRDELNVTSINAYIQLLDDKDNPAGDKLHKYAFENEAGKTVSVYVCAEVPKDYRIDRWLINGIPHHFDKAVASFKVFDLDATTAYEAVLVKTVQKVSVQCTNCTFSGGGYTNAKSGSVPKGTKITVKGTVDIGSPQVWEINGGIFNLSTYGKTFQYTVNRNTTFKYTGTGYN